VRPGRDLRRGRGQVQERDSGRAVGRVLYVRDVWPRRIRRTDREQRDGVRVRVQKTRPIQNGRPPDGRGQGRRVSTAGVHRGRGRAAQTVRAIGVRGVPVVRGRRWIVRVRRRAGRASRAVRMLRMLYSR